MILEPRYAKNLAPGDAVLLGSPEVGAFGVVLSVSVNQAFVQFQSGAKGWIPEQLAILGRNMLEEMRVELN